MPVDATGLRICGEGKWKVKRHGAGFRRAWRKVHLAIDATTLDIRAVEMTDPRQGDVAQAEELLSQLNPAEPWASVRGDGACDTCGFYRPVRSRGAEVIVPPQRNGSHWKDRADFVQARNDILAAVRHLGWQLWKKWRAYHRCSMGRFRLLGERLATRQPERQVAEAHVRYAMLNTFNRLGAGDGRARLKPTRDRGNLVRARVMQQHHTVLLLSVGRACLLMSSRMAEFSCR